MPPSERNALITQFRRRLYDVCEFIPFPHQAEWQLATEGYTLVPGRPPPGTPTHLAFEVALPERKDGKIVPDRVSYEWWSLAPRPQGIAHYATDFGAYKSGKSRGLAMWAAGLAVLPRETFQFIGLEYKTSQYEFNYLIEALLSKMKMKKKRLYNDPRGGRMLLELANGFTYEVMSWENKEAIKGGQVIGYGFTECLPLDAPVWMGDYSVKPIGDVLPGDRVLGWGPLGYDARAPSRRHSPRRSIRERMQRGKVLATHRRWSTTLTITLASGRTIRCTPDHQWLVSYSPQGGDYRYRRADALKIGDRLTISDLSDPGLCPSYLQSDAAWLGGIYDGEGSREGISQSRFQNRDVVLRILAILERLGFDAVESRSRRETSTIRWRGGRQAAYKFLRWVPSIRYRRKYVDAFLLTCRFRTIDLIVSIKKNVIAEQVACLTTSTGNFFAYGACSHNCYMLPGLEVFTSTAQNLRAKRLAHDLGFAIFTTTADRPWISALHDLGHGLDPDWHCTCSVPGEVNPFTFDQKAMDRDNPDLGGIMTRERFAIAWLGRMGSFVGHVYPFQRGERKFTRDTHPYLWQEEAPTCLESLKIPSHWEILVGADTGTYFSASIFAASPEDDLFWLEEFPNYQYIGGEIELLGWTVPEWAGMVAAAYHRYRPDRTKFNAWVDSNSQFRVEIHAGMILVPNNRSLELRTEIGREYFQANQIWLAPWLTIGPYELENAQWPDDATIGGKFVRIKRKDHTLDCFEHVASRRPRVKRLLFKREESFIERFVREHRRVDVHPRRDPHLGLL